MGCTGSKGTSTGEYIQKGSKLKKSSKRSVSYSRRDEVVVELDSGGNEATARLISEGNAEGSGQTLWEEGRKKNGEALQPAERLEKTEPNGHGGLHVSRLFSIRNGVDGAQAAAGWPPWLAAVAGEAIRGWLPRRVDSFEKMDKIGEGTYSSVYRARDLETGKIAALKKVRFASMDPESVRFMAREIVILRRLDHPNVMKLEGLVTSQMSGNLYLVFEYMEHDLAGLAASPTIEFSEPQIKCYMQQLLRGLEHCHKRGILHRDIKSSNLLIDGGGNLKIGDFGLAAVFRHRQKRPLTSRVVTLWYRPPELLLGATDYGAAVDLWSVGCVLAELFAGKPIMPGRTEVEQLHKIFKLCGSPSEEYWRKSKLPHATIFKPQHPYKRRVAEAFGGFPPSALTLLDSLLAVEPDGRGSAASALHSEFFTTRPFPCDPSALPKYPPSKEYDAKIRDDETRRNKSRAGARESEPFGNGTRESRALPAPDANAELQASIKKRRGQRNPKSSSEKYNPDEEHGSGSRGPSRNGAHDAHQAPTEADEPRLGCGLSRRYEYLGAHLSEFSDPAVPRGGSRFALGNGESGLSHCPEERPNGKYRHFNDAGTSHNVLDRSNSSGKKHEHPRAKGYPTQKNQIHYSGPLLPGGNMDDLLKEHEKQIQQAIRKALLDKTKTKTKTKTKNGYVEKGQTGF